MSADALAKRSKKLEMVRSELRKHFDDCDRMTRRTNFTITQEAPLLLTKSEEKALLRQVVASHGHIFIIQITYSVKKPRRRDPVTHISVIATRRQRRRKPTT